MALRVRVCRTSEVPEGASRGFDVEGVSHPVMVTNLGGVYYACSSICPHEDVSLLDGSREGLRVMCPGHGYEFDLMTGDCAHDPCLSLPRYRVSVESGELWVELI